MARKTIRERMKNDYEDLIQDGGYKAVSERWGVTKALAWRIINEDGYWPKDEKIKEQLILRARQRGIPVKRRGRKRDLFSMDPEELRLRLENRVELN